MNLFEYVVKFVKVPKIRFGYLSRLGWYNYLSDEEYVRREWKLNYGTDLNLEKPETFNEKLQWLKVNVHCPEYTEMVDKYAAKRYVAKRIGEEYIIPTLGVWKDFKEIDFDELPQKFVLKCTHDSGGIIICKDKKQLDIKSAEKWLNKYLNRNYYCHREWPYKNVPPQIIAEKYMQDGNNESLTDYKFYCFNGIPRYLYVSVGMSNHQTARMSFVTTDWKLANFGRTDYKRLKGLPQRPDKLEEMIEIAKKLSDKVPFLRVDLYEIDGKVYFGELTFTPCAGMMPFDPPEADLEIGKMLDISYLMNK